MLGEATRVTFVSVQLEVVRGDITTITVDAIVNAANTSLLGGGGVDEAIHRAGGPQILEDCRSIVARQGGCKVGEALITRAGMLPAKHAIHTVGPVWNGGHKRERELLGNCYRSSLLLADQHTLTSLAFPGISTGIYRFPKDPAAVVATRMVQQTRKQLVHVERVLFVCFDEADRIHYDRALSGSSSGPDTRL